MSINSVVNDTITGESLVNAQKPVPPAITGYSISGVDDTALDPAGGQTILLNGTGFQRGATVTLNGSAISVVTYVNANQLSFTSPAVSAGTYTIYAVNADGGTAIYIPGLIYSNLPTWTTSAGSLGSYYETQTIANTVIASGDAPVTYSLFSGALPTGAVFNANGSISGSAPVDSGSTTYSFTVRATDAQLQDSTRSFSLTINTDVVTWSSPASGATYTPTVNSVMANIGLTATSAAGSAVSYSANSLPIGVSLTGNTISGTPTSTGSTSTLLTATATATSRSATRTINWTIAVASDSYFGYNTLLLQGADTFVKDSSSNNFAVSIFGDTKPNNNNPYTPYSNYFDGTDDFLSYSSNTTLNFGTGDFTVECWINLGNTTGSKVIVTGTASNAFGLRYGTGFGVNNGLSIYRASVADLENCSFSFLPNVWYHVAVVRQSGVIKFFVNGTQQTTAGSGGASYNYAAETSVRIGTGDTGLEDYIGYISNLRVTKSAVYTANFTPTTTPLAAIANTSLLTCQSNLFVDRSTNAFAITNNGNTLAQQFHPFTSNTSYSGYGSAYFDGTGDYLTAPNNAAFNFGTGNFTVECWVYVISFTGSTNVIISTYQDGSNGWTIGITSNVFYGAAAGDTAEVRSSVTPAVNTWTHLALTRSSTTLSLFVNGVVAATQSNSTNMSTTSAVTIGTNVGGGALNFTGYITDVRIVKGTAVYTTAFTPPSAPLTAIANTSLLVLQNNQSVNNSVFLDNSTNNFFVTRNGNTTQGTFSPYGGNWSNYFTGSSYLNLPSSSALSLGTGDFCIEGWLNVSSASTVNTFIQTNWAGAGAGSSFAIWHNVSGYANKIYVASWSYNSGAPLMVSTTQLTFGQWYHIAVTRSGTSWKLFINGVSEATASGSYNIGTQLLYIGCYDAGYFFFQGYISNTRVVKGSAVYTSNFTPSTTPLTAIANTSLLTCQSNRFIDNSTNALALTISGTPTIQRYSPFNPSSLTATSYSGYFDGTGDYLSAASSSAFNVGTNSFCIEFWIYTSGFPSGGVADGIVSAGYSTNVHILGFNVTGFRFYVVGSFVDSTTAINLNAWNHVAFVRNGTTGTIYVNGVASGTGTLSGTGANSALYVGTSSHDLTETFTGYLSNVRFVNGSAVYTSNFTPPTSPLTAISGTSLLTLQSPTFIDNSTNNFTITAVGNSQPTIQNPFGYTSATTNGYTVSTIGGSGYFDGTGDYINTQSNVAFTFGTGDLTLEGWIYQTATSSSIYRVIFGDNVYGSTGGYTLYSYNNALNLWKGGGEVIAPAGTITLNAWNHVAWTRSGSSNRLFINGTQVGATTTDATNYTSTISYIGASVAGTFPFAGYITDARIIKGQALYTSNFVPPSAPLTAVQNTVSLLNMTSAGIYDATMQTNLETVGDARLSTAVSKFGSSSMSFDGTGDYLTSSSVNMAFGTGDFTIEGWFYINAGSGANNGALQISTTTGGLQANQTNTIALSTADSGGIKWSAYYANTYAYGSAAATQTWTHIALVRLSGSLKLYVNGTVDATFGTKTDTTNYTGQNICIGGYYSTTYLWNGYIDDLRITRGYARYTANFTPPTEAFMTK